MMQTIGYGPEGSPRNRVYVGLVFDQYTPAVEGQILKDVQQLQQVADRDEEVVLCCTSDKPDRLLRALNMRRVPTLQLAKMWILIKTQEDWPEVPEWCDTEVRRDLFVPQRRAPLLQVNEKDANGYYLPPQGRLSPDTLSLERPAPNGYIPVDPSLIMVWSKVTARLKARARKGRR